MTTEDISMVCDVLLGISNPNKEIRTNSINKLQELSNNLGALTFCLIEIASKTSNDSNEKTIKTTALILGRKIVETKSKEDWKNIPNDIKESIELEEISYGYLIDYSYESDIIELMNLEVWKTEKHCILN